MSGAASTPSPSEARDGPWYQKAFEAGYLDLYAHRDEADAARAVDFAASRIHLGPETHLLDLCCGPGRHLGLLTPKVGHAFGLDLSLVLLLQAREFCARKLRQERVDDPHRLALIRGDMRWLPFPARSFDVVVNLFTSIGYFEDDADNLRVLREIARTLTPGGALLIDHINRDHLEDTLKPESERQLRSGARVIERRSFEPGASRVIKNVQWIQDDCSTEWIESVRVFGHDELVGMLRSVGLIELETFGDFDGSDFTPDSPRMIILARRIDS